MLIVGGVRGFPAVKRDYYVHVRSIQTGILLLLVLIVLYSRSQRIASIMNRAANVIIPHIPRHVTASPSPDTKEHGQSPAPSDTALYTL